jgi:hypothetical protein
MAGFEERKQMVLIQKASLKDLYYRELWLLESKGPL